MLSVENLQVNYGAIRALHGISLKVEQGEVVTLIGCNGAGKTTTLRAISGIVKSSGGTVKYEGRDITRVKPHELVRLGIAHSPEGRGVFANMTVGHIILKIFAGFVVTLGSVQFFILPGILPFGMLIGLTALEFFVAFLQAYIFTILSCIYLNDAIHLH